MNAFVAAMNAGKAHLENREADPALASYRHAVDLEPENIGARINLALAHLLMRLKKDPQQNLQSAVENLDRALELDPDCTAAVYLRGLTHIHLNQPTEALADMENAVRLDPVTPTLRFQLGKAYEISDQTDKAEQQYIETIELDALHASAHFKLSRIALRQRRVEEGTKYNNDFLRLRELFGDASRNTEALESCRYTRAWDPAPPLEPVAESIPVRFVDVTAQWTTGLKSPTGPGYALGVIDADDDDRWDVFVAHADGNSAVWMGVDSGFQERALPPGPAKNWTDCLVGDYDNVGRDTNDDQIPDVFFDDVLLVSENGSRLLRHEGEGAFEDVSEASGVAKISATAATWVDFDHDGDLDILTAGGPGAPTRLWLNGDGVFSDNTAQAEIPTDLMGVASVAAGDLETDGAVDLILARPKDDSVLLINRRLGRFEVMPAPPGPWPTAVSTAVDDVNNDGYPDVLLLGRSEAVIVYSNGAGRKRIDVSKTDPTHGLFLDYDNDGWLDLCVLGAKRPLTIWRNLGQAGFEDVSESLGLSELNIAAPRRAAFADFDNDGDGDLMLTTDRGPVFLRNDGGNANHMLRLALRGTKGNRTGLGARIEIRAGNTRISRAFSRLPVEIGIGPHEALDSVRIAWTNGVIQNEIDVHPTPGEALIVIEKVVATGSCPFLFAWDGSRFRFVTDLLGNAPMGLSAARDKFLPADPTEFVRIGDDSDFVPRNGRFVVQVNNCFREILYLDEARLIAVDHPAGTEVHSRDKICMPPFPPSELWGLRPLAPLQSARGDDGTDWTQTLSRIDHSYTRPPRLMHSQLRGIAEPYSLELDFGPLPSDRHLVLALTGWLQYGDASVNIAASQSSTLPLLFPTLEAQTTDGNWLSVDAVVGLPAGKTKTILVDLDDRLPPDTRRLRLTTTFHLHWDRAAMLEKPTALGEQRHTLRLLRADLHQRGFFEISARGPDHPTTPDYENVLSGPPWNRQPAGWCTRYGDVIPLIDRSDNRFAILNGGDEATLEFQADDLPPLPDGWQRTFFFYSVGWDKDADYNVALGDRVEPLPFHGMEDALYGKQDYPLTEGEDDWRMQYNTRYTPAVRPGTTD